MTSVPFRRRRPNMRKVVILFPSGLTLGNLFCGVAAIIWASRGEFRDAGIWVLWGGIFDALDGRVARATNAGSEFGEELDSLVDAISFGLAPAMIMYFAVLSQTGWDWVFAFVFVACAVLRLARFNVEQAGTAKTYFQGLPSPAAGCTLASYYWFSQSGWYQYGAIGDLRWQEMMRFLMIGLSILMISNVPYPVFPRTGFRSLKALFGSLVIVTAVFLLWTGRLEYFFPLTLAYVVFGLLRWVFFGLFARRQPTIPYDLSEGEDDEDEEFELVPVGAPSSRNALREPAVREDKGRMHRSRESVPERPAREDRPPKGEGRDRGAKPQRTDAEKAARKERRDRIEQKRNKQSQREAQPASPAPVDGDPIADAPAESVIAGDIEHGAEVAVTSIDDQVARARKRKRRRRRGERKDRPGTEGSSEGSGEDSSSPYTEAPPSSSEPTE